MNQEELEEFVVTTQQIWRRRNTFVFHEKFIPPCTLVNQSSQAIGDYRRLFQDTPNSAAKDTNLDYQWTTPPYNTYKINWDVTINKIHCKVGI